MPDFILKEKSPLADYNRDFSDLSIREITGKALVSVATPLGGDKKLFAAMDKSYGAKLPRVGASTHSKDGKVRFLGLQSEQMFVLFEYTGQAPVKHVAKKLGNAAYYSDQSDSWVMVELAGSQCRAALARICPLDLHEESFVEGALGRTAMEHLGVIIYRSGPDEFIILSPRSSAHSLLHAIETSALNIAI